MSTMTKKEGERYTPAANEVVIDYHMSRALREFTYAELGRPVLEYVLVGASVMVATDGKTMVKMPVEEKGEMRTEARRLLHRDVLLAVRTKSDRMAVSLDTGEVVVHGAGPMYPVRLPDAPLNGEEETYPDYSIVVNEAAKRTPAARVGIDPTLVNRLMSVQQRTGPVVLDIPPDGDGGYVHHPIRFRVTGNGATGLIMPMRVYE